MKDSKLSAIGRCPPNTLSDIPWEHVSCPLCGSEQSSVCLRADDLLFGLPGEFHLVRCCDCRHVYLNPRPTPEGILSFYPEDYGPHHLQTPVEGPPVPPSGVPDLGRRPWYVCGPLRRIPGLRRLYHWLSESYAQIIPEVDGPSKRALEIGCADGRFLEQLQRRGWEAQGVEPAAEPASRAQQRGLRVHHGRLEPGLFPADHFDAAFAWMVVEHLHDPKGVLGEVHRVLKASGWLVFSVPNFGCWEPKVFGRYWYPLQPPTHLHQFTPRTLQRLLDASGFKIVRVIHQRNVFNLVGSMGLWLREKLRARRVGHALVQWTDHPGLWSRLAMAPLAILLAWLRQGGRVTVVARPKPSPTPGDSRG